jgi:hypothetical protein
MLDFLPATCIKKKLFADRNFRHRGKELRSSP